jgi:phosphoglycolate phosphatase
MMPKWIIVFDWDGTLIESLPLKIKNAGQLFAETFEVAAADVEAAYRVHSGIPRRQLFDAICVDNGLPALTAVQYEPLSAAFTARNQESVSRVQVEPVVAQTLGTLSEMGLPLFISTSAAPDEVRSVANSLKLAHFFYEILGSLGNFTKGPVHIEHILKKYPLNKQDIWFVGDEPSDVRLGKAAGVRTVAKLGSHPRGRLEQSHPDVIIETLTELIPLLERS